jgi:hypothetical protein
MPGNGVSYRGSVRKDDYGLNLVIPSKLTGWGAAEGAPFHGFTIFLSDQGKPAACLEFEIHLRVPLGEDTNKQVPGGYKVEVGNIQGRRQERTGLLDGVPFQNVMVEFSFRRNAAVYDGAVWLVTPKDAAVKNGAILKTFLSHVRFEGIDDKYAR